MTRAPWLGAALVGGVAWLAAAELAMPARVFVVLLAAGVPAVSLAQMPLMQQILADGDRLSAYVSSIITIWLLGVGAVLAGLLGGFERAELGLAGLPALPLIGWTAACTAAGLGLLALGRAARIGETTLVADLLPRTRREKLVFVGLSISAGIGEEAAYRGFLVPALAVAAGSLPAGVALAAALFGLVHVYQGAAGSLRAALLGLLLTAPVLVTGSLLPAVLAHAAIDIIAGIWLANWLLRRRDPAG